MMTICGAASTCHKVYGEAFALLAGDALLTYAFACADNPYTTPLKTPRNFTAAAAGHDGMIGGQICDLQMKTRHLTLHLKILDTHRMKTGLSLTRLVHWGIAADYLGGADDEKPVSAAV